MRRSRRLWKFHFRSVTNEGFNQANSELSHIELPFTIDYFGGWQNAYSGSD
jgi:hypothetical protein